MMKKLLVAVMLAGLIGCDESNTSASDSVVANQDSANSGSNSQGGGDENTVQDQDSGAGASTDTDVDSGEDADTGADSSTGSDSNTGTDTDVDSESGEGASVDTDTGASTGADADTGTDSSTGSDSSTGTDTDADADSGEGADVDTDTGASTGTDADTGTDTDTGSNVDTDSASDASGGTDLGANDSCSRVAELGSPVRLLDDSHRTDIEYDSGGLMEGAEVTPEVFELMSDGCVSDTAIAELTRFEAYRSPNEKGLYLWLAPESGAATITAIQTFRESLFSPPNPYLFKHVIQSSGGIEAPVFIALPNLTMTLTISPLQADSPVKISEIRLAGASDDVSQLRKARFSSDNGFVASNSDPRALVTAEIASLFAKTIYNTGGWVNSYHCGNAGWADMTWELDQGVAHQVFRPESGYSEGLEEIFVNWEKATNEEIWQAIENSLKPEAFSCFMPSKELIEQDWVGKAEAARQGNYSGPTQSLTLTPQI